MHWNHHIQHMQFHKYFVLKVEMYYNIQLKYESHIVLGILLDTRSINILLFNSETLDENLKFNYL